MRRLVVAVLVAVLALSLAGCGGGGEEAAAPPTDSATAPPPPPPAAPAEADAAPIADRSDATSETFEPIPSGVAIPDAVAERLERDQAMLLFFYNSSQKQTNDVRAQVDSVVDDNLGLIDLIAYDLSKYSSVDDDGSVDVDEAELADDAKAQQAVRFAREMGVDYTPYIIIVDDQGYRIFWSRGFIDAELLERQVERAVE